TKMKNTVETKGDIAAQRGDKVPAGESVRILTDQTRHPGKHQKMHRKKCQVNADERGPEMNFSKSLVVLAATHLPYPIVKSGKYAENRPQRQHIMKMGHDVVGVVDRVIDACIGHHNPSDAADGE